MQSQALSSCRPALARPARGLHAGSARAAVRVAPLRVCAAAGKLTLYTNPRSRSQIIEWYAKEVGITYDVVNVDMAAGEHKAPEYLAVNPFGKLPAIQCDDGTAVFESGAILLYLADRYGGLTTPEQRAVAAQWVVFANATFSPAMFNSSQRAQQLPLLCGALNTVLSKSKFLLGDEFSVADVAMGAYFAYVTMFFPDVNYEPWPAIVEYMKRIEKRPAFAATIGSE